MSEKKLSEPYQDTVEGVLICPDCGLETHCYYLSHEIRNRREYIMARVARLSGSGRIPETTVRQIQALRKEYNDLFDAEQKKYGQLVKKAVTQDDRAE